MALSAVSGVVRAGHAIIVISGDPTALGRVLAVQFYRGRKIVGQLMRTWPDDFVFEDSAAPDHGTITIQDIDRFSPFASVDLLDGDQPLSKTSAWNLRQLYAKTPEQFEKFFYQRKNRIPDRETLQFSARQITRHYELDEAQRAVAAVIQAYGAIDLSDQTLLTEATSVLLDQIERAKTAPLTGETRTDGVQQIGSMRLVLWQLYLFTGQYEAFLQALDDHVGFMRTHKTAYARIVFNGCRAIQLRTYIYILQGELDKAKDMASFNANYYVTNLVNIEHRSMWFREVRHAHDTVVLALSLVERAVAGKPLPSERDVLKTSHRLVHAPSVDILEQRFKAFCNRLSQAPRNG